MRQVFFSVIIPIYNAEKYLKRAVGSIINQTFPHVEIILVDDGSTDTSLKICVELKKQDKRINIIHLEKNGGPGQARNMGIKKARGEYILFVDADDFVDANLLQQVQSCISENAADVVVFGMVEDYLGENGNSLRKNKILPAETIFCATKEQVRNQVLPLQKNTLFRYAFDKVYKRSMIESNALFFENYVVNEDADFNLKVFEVINSLWLLKIAGYHYERRPSGSLTSSFVPDYFELHMNLIEKTARQFARWNKLEETKIYLAGEFIKYVFLSLQMTYNPKCVDREEKQKEILEQIYVNQFYINLQLNNLALNPKYKLLWSLLQTKNSFAITLAARLLYLIKNKGKWLWIRIK